MTRTIESLKQEQSSVGFPALESTSGLTSQPAPLIRPFRRISLPSFPSVLHRNSVASVSSSESFLEEQITRPGLVASPSNPAHVRLTRPARANLSKTRPISIESPKRRTRKRSSSAKPSSDARAQQQKKIVDEFYATEQTYVDGLEMIYSLFLAPIIASLETSNPLLDRTSLTNVFSNFIDIWNLHHSFFSALKSHLQGDSSSVPPPISPPLLSHFPYLSLYNPFITAFPSMISTLSDMTTPPSSHRPNPRYNYAFATFVATQEADPRCGKFKLRDWLLTIVQRCPRYLLLLRDLIRNTEEDDPELVNLTSVLALVTKITSSMDASIHSHAQTLALIALQRSTAGLPFQLVEPGRMLLKRGSLLHIERSSNPRDREFLLFTDCFLWLANEDGERSWGLGWSTSTGSDSTSSSPQTSKLATNSKSKAVAEPLKAGGTEEISTTPKQDSKVVPPPMKKPLHPPPPVPRKAPSTGEERWIFKGQISLVDVDVIVTPPREQGDERRFEVLSPEGSFVLYAGSEDERDDWVSGLRQAKVQFMATLNVTNPNSTLTSSSSTNHLRRSLQALPFPPSDERIATLRHNNNKGIMENGAAEAGQDSRNHKEQPPSPERRRKVEHWVPAIWIPDAKTDSCMRCGKSFNWRRRRHHCRLCGRCVCAPCSGRTFFIADPNAKEPSSKPARACDACYETVFPLVDPPQDPGPLSSANSSSFLSSSVGTINPGKDTITALSMLPSWVSMPTLPTQGSQPQALMADLSLSTDLEVTTSAAGDLSTSAPSTSEREMEVGRIGRIRLKSSTRPKSFHQIFEDFQHGQQHQHQHHQQQGRQLVISPSSPSALIDSAIEEHSESPSSEEEEEENDERIIAGEGHRHTTSPLAFPPSSVTYLPNPSPRRKEDTTRRSKRFSLPAVALHTTNVTARTTSLISNSPGGGGGNGSSNTSNGGVTNGVPGGAMGRLRRLSLVSGGRI